MLDIEKLIREVYVRSTIWDQNHPQHHNREAVQKLWAEIAESCDTTSKNGNHPLIHLIFFYITTFSVQAAKTKWKNLRDCFRTEYKKQLKGKSNDVNNSDSPTPPSTWLWYRDLLFLKDQIGTKRKVQNFPIANQEAEEEIIEPKFDIYYDDIKVESMDSVDEGISRDSHCQPSVASASSQLHTAEEYLRRRIPLFTHENLWNPGLFPFGNLADDDSYHFLMSLHKPLNSLPNEREMFIRYKIQELLYNEIFRMH